MSRVTKERLHAIKKVLIRDYGAEATAEFFRGPNETSLAILRDIIGRSQLDDIRAEILTEALAP